METWQLTDLLLRGATSGLLVLVAVQFARISPASARTLSVSLLAVGLVCYLGVSSPTILPVLGGIAPVFIFMAVLNPFLLWWAFNGLFDDGFDLRIWHLLPLGLVLVPAYLDKVWADGDLFRGFVVAALYLHLIWVAIRTSPFDLVEARRRFRSSFLGVAAIFGIGVTFVESRFPDGGIASPTILMQSGIMLLLVLAFTLWASAIRQDIWLVRQSPFVADEKNNLGPADRALLVRLEAEMAEGVWRQEGLSIGTLAGQIKVPEHRLRRVINRELGYRNFARFINERRVTEACSQLNDPQRAEAAILTVAYDVGFASLGPFNRAFREVTGQSPSEYRAQKLTES